MPPPRPVAASAAVGLAGLMWGLWWIPLRHVSAGGLAGDWASVSFYALAAVLMAPFMWRRRGALRAGGVDLLVIGALTGGAFALWNHVLIDGVIVRVTLLFYLAPVWATAINAAVFREPVRLLRGVAVLLGLAGAAAVLGVERGLARPLMAADWLALLCGMLFAVCAVWTQRAPHLAGREKTFVSVTVAAPVALALAVFLPHGPLPPPAAFAGVLPVIGAGTLWLMAVMWLLLWGAAYLDAGWVAILLLLEIVAAAVSASLLTAEPFGLREIVGCALILAAGIVEGVAAIRLTRGAAGRAA
jgi:drug/metabolite transporter (DMT)-like permease